MPKADIVAQGYDLSLNRYKEVVHEVVDHQSPSEILAELAAIEEEIRKGMKQLGLVFRTFREEEVEWRGLGFRDRVLALKP